MDRCRAGNGEEGGEEQRTRHFGFYDYERQPV
jgi:hypothetical protein